MPLVCELEPHMAQDDSPAARKENTTRPGGEGGGLGGSAANVFCKWCDGNGIRKEETPGNRLAGKGVKPP